VRICAGGGGFFACIFLIYKLFTKHFLFVQELGGGFWYLYLRQMKHLSFPLFSFSSRNRRVLSPAVFVACDGTASQYGLYFQGDLALQAVKRKRIGLFWCSVVNSPSR
jgi:hypothetical protein